MVRLVWRSRGGVRPDYSLPIGGAYVFACARWGRAQGTGRAQGKGEWSCGVNGQVLRRNVGGTNQIADRVIGHQRSCEYHAVCVFSPKQRC